MTTKHKDEETKAPPPEAETAKPGMGLAVYDYGSDAGAGSEEATVETFRIPMLRILQALSPQCKDVEQGGTEGARPGMIFNTATNEMYPAKTPIPFTPVFYKWNYVEYVPRVAGGGFVAVHELENHRPPAWIEALRKAQTRFGKLVMENGNELAETHYIYNNFGPVPGGLDVVQRVIIPFTSTQIKKSSNFMTLFNNIRYPGKDAAGKPSRVLPPMWAHRWLLSTAFEKNKKGDFYGWKIDLADKDSLKARIDPTSVEYAEGRAFYDMIKSGVADVDHASAAKERAPDEEEIPL